MVQPRRSAFASSEVAAVEQDATDVFGEEGTTALEEELRSQLGESGEEYGEEKPREPLSVQQGEDAVKSGEVVPTWGTNMSGRRAVR